jgi:hypothetical protein
VDYLLSLCLCRHRLRRYTRYRRSGVLTCERAIGLLISMISMRH